MWNVTSQARPIENTAFSTNIIYIIVLAKPLSMMYLDEVSTSLPFSYGRLFMFTRETTWRDMHTMTEKREDLMKTENER